MLLQGIPQLELPYSIHTNRARSRFPSVEFFLALSDPPFLVVPSSLPSVLRLKSVDPKSKEPHPSSVALRHKQRSGQLLLWDPASRHRQVERAVETEQLNRCSSPTTPFCERVGRQTTGRQHRRRFGTGQQPANHLPERPTAKNLPDPFSPTFSLSSLPDVQKQAIQAASGSTPQSWLLQRL